MTGGYRKIKLLSLMVALVVTGLAVVGGTWAWGVNYNPSNKEGGKIDEDAKTLNYNVDFLYHDGNGYNCSLLSNNVFDGTTWCPGMTQIVYLKIKNNEDFAVGVSIDMVVDENTFDGDMEYAVLYNQNLKADGAEHPSSWEVFKKRVVSQGDDVQGDDVDEAGIMTAHNRYRLLHRQSLSRKLDQHTGNETIGNEMILAGSDTYYLALAIHMDESTTKKGGAAMHFNIQVDADAQITAKPTNQ